MNSTVQANESTLEAELNAIIHELAQCREDERAAKNQIFQILTAICAFLAVTAALSTAEAAPEFLEAEFLFPLTVALLCAALPFMANMGLLSTFRHHYMKALEERLFHILQENTLTQLVPWERASNPLISLNPKHNPSGYKRFYSMNMHLTFAFILVLACIYLYIGYAPSLVNNLAILIFCVVLVIVVTTILISQYRSKNVYQYAIQVALKDLGIHCEPSEHGTQANDSGQAFRYFLYPRPKDLQKGFFLVVGYAFGYLLSPPHLDPLAHVVPFLRELFLVWFVFDFLIYQARYQFNDIRGVVEDGAHPQKQKRGRLPISLYDPDHARTRVRQSLAIAGARLLLAVLLIGTCYTERAPLLLCFVLVFVLAAVYERFRAKNCAWGTFVAVGFGYPLRFAAGIFATDFVFEFPHPLSSAAVLDWLHAPAGVGLLLGFSLYFFGWVFVSLLWALEVAAHPNTGKKHLLLLHQQLDKHAIGQKYPLRPVGKWPTIWNLGHLLSSACIACGLAAALGDQWLSFQFAGFTFALSLLPTVIDAERIDRNINPRAASFLLTLGPIWSIYLLSGGAHPMATLLLAMQTLYLVVYVVFRDLNYEELYAPILPPILKFLQKGFDQILTLLVGKPVFNVLFRQSKV